jgi:hypothetical protein
VLNSRSKDPNAATHPPPLTPLVLARSLSGKSFGAGLLASCRPHEIYPRENRKFAAKAQSNAVGAAGSRRDWNTNLICSGRVRVIDSAGI